jgi:hypothetical protein
MSVWGRINEKRSAAAARRTADKTLKKVRLATAGGKFTLSEVREATRRFDPSFGGQLIWSMRGKEWVYRGDYFEPWHEPGICRAPDHRLGEGVTLHAAAQQWVDAFFASQDREGSNE